MLKFTKCSSEFIRSGAPWQRRPRKDAATTTAEDYDGSYDEEESGGGNAL